MDQPDFLVLFDAPLIIKLYGHAIPDQVIQFAVRGNRRHGRSPFHDPLNGFIDLTFGDVWIQIGAGFFSQPEKQHRVYRHGESHRSVLPALRYSSPAH
nr:hypothetical protein [Marinobacter subterrani]